MNDADHGSMTILAAKLLQTVVTYGQGSIDRHCGMIVGHVDINIAALALLHIKKATSLKADRDVTAKLVAGVGFEPTTFRL